MREDVWVILDGAHDGVRVVCTSLPEFERPIVYGCARQQTKTRVRKRSGDVADPEIIGEPQAEPSANHEMTPPPL